MPGQGYHFGFARLMCEKTGRDFTNEMKVGTLLLDAMNSAAGSRRNSHFTGGAGCVLPRYTELRQCGNIQAWDSNLQKSYLVDPRIDMRLFEAANIHIMEGDYKDGIRFHLLSDRSYDQLVQTRLFDVSRQKENIIVVRSTGEELDGPSFRKELYASYPMLDQYLMELSGITADDIEEVKDLLWATLSDEHAVFICKYLNYNPEFVWKDTRFFNKEVIDNLVEEAIKTAGSYLQKR
jgi:hypothetical protein